MGLSSIYSGFKPAFSFIYSGSSTLDFGHQQVWQKDSALV